MHNVQVAMRETQICQSPSPPNGKKHTEAPGDEQIGDRDITIFERSDMFIIGLPEDKARQMTPDELAVFGDAVADDPRNPAHLLGC